MISNKMPLDNTSAEGVKNWIEDLIAVDVASHRIEQEEYAQLIKTARAWDGGKLDPYSPLERYRLQAVDRTQPHIDACYDPVEFAGNDDDGLMAAGAAYLSKLSLKHFRNERHVPDRISREVYDEMSRMLIVARETGVLHPALRTTAPTDEGDNH